MTVPVQLFRSGVNADVTMGRTFGKRLSFERLENRRLLAADLGAEIMPCDMEQTNEQVETTCDFVESADEAAVVDFNDVAAPAETGFQTLDLADGSDGIFSQLTSIQAKQGFEFTPEHDGIVDVVVASDFGDASTNLMIRNGAGEMISATDTNALAGFHTLSIEVDAGETYDLLVGSEDGGTGDFQLTVGFTPSIETSPPDGDVIVDQPGEETESESHPEDAESDLEDEGVSQDEGLCDSEETGTDVESDELPEELPQTDVPAEPSDDIEMESEPTTKPELEEDVSESSSDIHADLFGPESTEIDMTQESISIQGSIDQPGDVDTFRFTAQHDGQMEMFLGDVTQGGDLELNVTVVDSFGNEIVDGATNEIVLISFEVQSGSEYFVAISADGAQTGDFNMAMEAIIPQPADDHANQRGDEATQVIMDSTTGSVNGVLETAVDRDAFRMTANASGETEVAVVATSEGNESLVSVSIFDGSGELLIDGTTNDAVELLFNAVQGAEYFIMVDSLNDVPAEYSVNITHFEQPINESESETNGECEQDAMPIVPFSESEDTSESRVVDKVFGDLLSDPLDDDLGFDDLRFDLESRLMGMKNRHNRS